MVLLFQGFFFFFYWSSLCLYSLGNPDCVAVWNRGLHRDTECLQYLRVHTSLWPILTLCPSLTPRLTSDPDQLWDTLLSLTNIETPWSSTITLWHQKLEVNPVNWQLMKTCRIVICDITLAETTADKTLHRLHEQNVEPSQYWHYLSAPPLVLQLLVVTLCGIRE